LKEKDSYAEEEAKEKFGIKWEQIGQNITNLLDSRSKIEERSFSDISTLYKDNIKGY